MALLAFGAVLAFPSPVLACTCAPIGHLGAVRQAEVAFSGTATHIFDPGGKGPLVSTGRIVQTTFEVDGVFKGDVPESVRVLASADGASCGFAFEVGKRYKVYGTSRGDSVETGLCTGTTLIAAGDPGGPNPAVPGDADEQPTDGAPAALVVTTATAVLALVGTAGVVLVRTRRRNPVDPPVTG